RRARDRGRRRPRAGGLPRSEHGARRRAHHRRRERARLAAPAARRGVRRRALEGGARGMSAPEGRAAVARAKRIVVQIGSRALAEGKTAARLAQAVASARAAKRSVVLVSSGAIALGAKKLGYRTRPKEMARLQAAAAAGQSLLMRAYEEAFGAVGLLVAQVL